MICTELNCGTYLVRGPLPVKCHDCVTSTKRRFKPEMGRYRFCQYQEI